MAKTDDKPVAPPTQGGSYVVGAGGKLKREAFTRPVDEETRRKPASPASAAAPVPPSETEQEAES